MTKTPKVRKQAKRELNVRQVQVLTYLALGKRVREIAQKLGVSDDSIRRDIRRLEETKTYDNRLKVELEKHCLLWNKAFACIEANLDYGNLKAAEDVLRYTGIWLDKLEVVGKIDPGDQQKRMIENMEKLLKLKIGEPKQIEVKGRLEPDWERIKPEDIKPGAVLPGVMRRECSCPKGIDGEPMGAFAIDSNCPVHGDRSEEHKEKKTNAIQEEQGSHGQEENEGETKSKEGGDTHRPHPPGSIEKSSV